jgi:ceramide glucosyltransferase
VNAATALLFSASWRVLILILAALPLAYYAAATIAAWRFFRRTDTPAASDYRPPVSVLKPVRGIDFASYENFASFCRQDYPQCEILFGVGDHSDPAVPLIRRLMQDFPHRAIRLLIGAPQLGTNRKVNMLARLAQEAEHDILLLTDGDVRIPAHYISSIVAPLSDPHVGAVTSFYRAIAQRNLGAELEAIGATSDFFAGVLMAEWMEGMTFALGASIATTKSWLAKIGGFAAIADWLADDYELGHRIHKAGGRVTLSKETVWTMYPAQTARGFWQHQLRWARTVRLCRPASYFGLIVTHGLPWAVLAAFVAPTAKIGAGFLLAYLILRILMAWMVGVWGIGDDVLRRRLWLLPLRDAIHVLVWVVGFASSRIHWGGEDFIMHKGQLISAPPGRKPA